MFWPHNLYHDAANQRTRFAIEARLLARQTNREIAFHEGCAEEYVEVYEAVYFNVRERLRYRDCIVNTVFREAASRGIQGRDYDLVWKLAGYFHGPRSVRCLDQWIRQPDVGYAGRRRCCLFPAI